jgi:hypothetical protein
MTFPSKLKKRIRHNKMSETQDKTDLSLIFFDAFELMGKFVIDNLNSLCHGHHKTHTKEVYDGAENTKS